MHTPWAHAVYRLIAAAGLAPVASVVVRVRLRALAGFYAGCVRIDRHLGHVHAVAVHRHSVAPLTHGERTGGQQCHPCWAAAGRSLGHRPGGRRCRLGRHRLSRFQVPFATGSVLGDDIKHGNLGGLLVAHVRGGRGDRNP